MNVENAAIPVTDFVKEWCECCRIRIDKDEERTRVNGKIYHPDCYLELIAATKQER